VISPISLTIDAPLLQQLRDHLFPGDDDEHGAVIAAGISETPRGTRLLAREVFLARDGIDYVPGTRGYRALTPAFVSAKAGYCAQQGLCYLAVHCHGGHHSVEFSPQDIASHERGYHALLDITHGGPVGALVFAEQAVAGDIWTPSGRHALDHLTVVGPHVQRLYPAPQLRPTYANPIYDRHALLFGNVGQDILSGLKVGIIGLGGGGSLLNEWLARLGVGHIVAVDPDYVDLTNLPRIVGATRRDAAALLTGSPYKWLRELGQRLARYKAHVARRVAKQANPDIRYDAVVGNVLDESVARLLTDADFLFLATDSISSRLVFNTLVQQYLIPGAQIGVKVPADRTTHQVGDITVATRLVLPGSGQGCLECQRLIPPARVQHEALSEDEHRDQRYVESEMVAEPSVITLNALSAAPAANDLMMMFTGLYHDRVHVEHLVNWVRERALRVGPLLDNPTCTDCSTSSSSHRARGDRARLPCRPGR
jgi:molybdopterin/thiamine biosynthesis adenylyltransferase